MSKKESDLIQRITDITKLIKYRNLVMRDYLERITEIDARITQLEEQYDHLKQLDGYKGENNA